MRSRRAISLSMATAYFRFHAELNDFLPFRKRQTTIVHCFQDRASIKDMIEALGVPHPEVDCIEVNGKAVDFSYIITDGDACHQGEALLINVYPVSAATATHTVCVGWSPPPVCRFVLDIHLGKLATFLRLLGFDTLYRNDYLDQELAQISAAQQRILLTRDKGLLMRSLVTYGYYVRHTDPEQQVVEVLHRFELFNSITPFQRCLRCNGLLEPASKESLIDQLPLNTQMYINEFYRCQACEQIYWKGAHYKRMQQFISRVLKAQ